MNRRNCVLLTLVTALFLLTGSVSAQITNAIKSDPNVTPHLQTIDMAVKAQVARMQDPQNPAAMGQARDALVGYATSPGGGVEASPSYLDALAASINTNIQPLAKPQNPVRVRLNAAIAVAKVAERAPNTRLMNAALLFLNDTDEPVALWGLKASRPLLVQILNTLPLSIKEYLPVAQGAAPPPPGPVSKAVERFESGLIAQEAYNVLALSLVDNTIKPASYSQVVPELLKTLEHRVRRAASKQLEEPRADTQASLYLSNSRIWNAMAPAQQQQTMQLLSDLIWLQAQWASRINEQAQRMELITVIDLVARAIDVIAAAINDQNLRTAVATAREIGANTPPREIPAQVQGLFAAIQANPAFKNLKAPPTVSQSGAAPATTQTQIP